MTTVLSRRPLADHPLFSPTSSLDRLLRPADIRFSGGLDGAVRIEITFRNTTDAPSPTMMARIEAAPLGAFVRGVPIASIRVPRLHPGESWVFTRRVPYTPPTANQGGRASIGANRVTAAGLPADPLHELGCGGVHWAGNINVFVGEQVVERHVAMALRAYPGIVNLVKFFVGSGPDSYRFELSGDGTAWEPGIFVANSAMQDDPDDTTLLEVGPGSWIDVLQRTRARMIFTPPAGCREGSLDVVVTQRSSGRTARVEFSFAHDAEGPGCYTL